MRNIATCYSEHAVKVSDSYCSGPLNKSYISPKSSFSIQNVVSCTYKTQISNQKCLYITISWCNKLICQGFFIKISEKNSGQNPNDFHEFPKMKGTKYFEEFRVHWDVSSAIFEAGPKPIKGFYILIMVDSKFSVVIGDMEDDPIVKNMIKGLISPKLRLISQCENFNGDLSNQISTKARFSDAGEEHEIMIKSGPEEDGPRSPIVSILIDKKRVIKIKRLQWNFRGNQVIFVDGLLVDVMWDFDQTVGRFNNGGNGIFMFRTRSGLDSRLWLEEEERNLVDKNYEKSYFSLIICASNKNPS
ncbi:uncharacterized protein LOC130827121 [Amaranthus tricolor]|uniref:uncharacterized protein LOC130827121 n=1 Tax=Amaranthus tricolor TaxID=29722 RepID=UPI00258D4B52|nr:uncharacterized protein LOC130827121 [Amaranthus tricolor]